ncbi:L,D-transpeptidase [uncultured Microbacterium sp.]|uniref:L,D-transpeptidase n=1 Tax=uncultured Microbacterium sp. TaxID=191216 RepID=UPI0028DB5870|nr:L,D-transpeptidase [uncultured Microbacterium sp.]
MPGLPTDRRRSTVLIVVAVAVCALIAAALLLLRPAETPDAGEPVATATGSPTPADDTAETPAPATEAPAEVFAPAESTVAAVIGDTVTVSERPGGAATQTLTNPQPSGAPLVFRVEEVEGEWLRVLLTQRPNGSTGWIPAAAVRLSTTPYALVVTTSTNTLDLYEGGVKTQSFPVATGTGGTPTPTGRFALTELLAPTNSGYGPFAYGVSAFSEALTSFGGGPGQIGLHGTDDEGSIGSDASHGCIRMRNDDIVELAGILPLGTPIQVR